MAFKESDVTRALRAAQKAGRDPSVLHVAPDGSIRIEFAGAEKPEAALDTWLRDNASKTSRP